MRLGVGSLWDRLALPKNREIATEPQTANPRLPSTWIGQELQSNFCSLLLHMSFLYYHRGNFTLLAPHSTNFIYNVLDISLDFLLEKSCCEKFVVRSRWLLKPDWPSVDVLSSYIVQTAGSWLVDLGSSPGRKISNKCGSTCYGSQRTCACWERSEPALVSKDSCDAMRRNSRNSTHSEKLIYFDVMFCQ